MSNTALSEQLAAKLGRSPDEAERALHEVLDEIKRRVQAGEDVKLTGLGTFSMDEGALRFTPSPALQMVVNYRHDHLEPLTVSESLGPAAPDDEGMTPVSGAALEEAFPPSAVAEPPEESEPAETEAAFARDEPEPVEPEPTKTEDVPDLSEDWTEGLDEETADASPSEEPDAASAREASDAPSTAQLAGLAASIALLVGLIWFVLGSQGIVTGPQALFQRGPAPASTPADTVAAATSADTATADAPPSDTAEATASEPAPPASSTPSTIDRATGGWTIVVASRTRPGQAKAMLATYRQRFRSEGIPVDILTGESGGQLRYRVAIGQYSSQEAALTARQQLQGRVPDDAWTLQIQPDS